MFATIISIALATSVLAQGRPTVEIVVGAPAGGPLDQVARQFQEAVSAVDINRDYIVVYKPGAAGSIAYGYVTRGQSNPTIMMLSSGQFSELILNKDIKEIFQEMRLIGPVWSSPGVLAVGPKSGINSVSDFIKKGQQGKMSCGAASRSIKLAMDYLSQEMQFKNTETVMFKGTADGLPIVVQGDIDCWLDVLHGPVHTYSQSGRVKIIALSETTSHPALPNTPLLKDSLPPSTLFQYSWWVSIGISETNNKEFRDAIGPIIAQAVKKLKNSDTIRIMPLAEGVNPLFAETATNASRLNAATTKK